MSELTPYLAVRDAKAAVAWYVEHLGAVVTYDPIVMDDGRIGHVELTLDGARWMMADEYPEIHVEAPPPGRGSAVTLHLSVPAPDLVDSCVASAVQGGALLDREPEDGFAGRVAVFQDPFGHRWLVNHSA